MKTVSPRIGCLLLFLLAPFAAPADDVTDAIEEGSASYQSGDYEQAAGMLEYAASLIRQMRGGKLEDLLPETPEGWESEGPSSQAVGAALMGGGTTASQSYTQGEKSVNVTFVGDSPMLQSMAMLFSNPALAAASGMRFKRVNGEKVLVDFEDGEDSGELAAFVAGKWLVTISGEAVTVEELLEWGGRVDFSKLAEF